MQLWANKLIVIRLFNYVMNLLDFGSDLLNNQCQLYDPLL